MIPGSVRLRESENIGRSLSAKCHETWKLWHYKAVDEILTFDAVARAEEERPIGHGVKEWTEHTRSLWRKVNDSIIWSLAGRERHVVKRLCLYRNRTSLIENNAEGALRVLAQYNSNPMSMAVWNDATSCVDIGDVTFVENGMIPMLQFGEIKEGEVNAEIMAMMKLKDQNEMIARLQGFAEKRGVYGIKQVDRFIRQIVRDKQMLSLLWEDQGFDPVSEREIKVLDQREHALENYDPELGSMLAELQNGASEAWRLIDQCLWVYVNRDRGLGPGAVQEKFKKLMADRDPRLRDLLQKRLPQWDLGGMTLLNEGFSLPMALPLFLRGIDPAMIGDIAAGQLMYRVYLYLDWDKFGDLIREEGAEFRWSSEKAARRGRSQPFPLRHIIVYGRIPQIITGKSTGAITGPNLIQVYFDGLRPRSLARLAVDTAKKMIARASAAEQE